MLGAQCLQQSRCKPVHCRHDQVCTSDMVIVCQIPQRGDEDAPHGNAPEQHLQRGRIFLHRLLRGEQDQHPLRHRRDAHQTIGQEAEQGYQCADSGTDPISCVGRCEDLQVWLSQRDCGEEDDLPQRQGADHRAVGKTDKWTHHLAQHRL